MCAHACTLCMYAMLAYYVHCREYQRTDAITLLLSLPPTSLSLSLSPPPSSLYPSPLPLPLPAAQLLKEAQGYAQVTPLQVSYLFDLCSMEEKAAGSISLSDFQRLLPRQTPFSQRQATNQPPVSSEVSGIIYSTYRVECALESSSVTSIVYCPYYRIAP